LIADERPSVVVSGVTVYDGDLISSNATNSDGTPTLASLDVYIAKVVGAKKFKRLILNPQVFNSYGHLSWGSIREVNQSVMDAFTTSALVRVDMTVDPSGKVYAMAPSGDTGAKSWVNLTASQFTGVSGTDADSIYTINSVDAGNYTGVTDITTTTQLSTFYSTGVLPGVIPVPAGGLSVSLSANTPAATTHASGTAYNGVLEVNLTAGSDASVNVTSLTLTRGGISADSSISGVAVFDSTGVRHGNFVTFSDAKALVSFSSNPIAVAAGQTVPVMVKTNISGTSGTYNVSVAQAADIGTTATVTGTFPVTGNTYSMTSGTSVVGALTVDAVLVHNNSTNDGTTVSVNLGTTNQEIARFRFVANANEDVKISKITMYNNGNANDADIQNIKLVGPDGTVLATVAQATDRNVVFNLSASPYTITKGNTKDLSLRIDVVGGSTRNVRFVIQNDYDIEATGASTGSGILATAATTVDGAFPIGDTSAGGTNCSATTNCINKLTVSAGTVTFNKASDSLSGNVAVGATNVELGKWEFTPNGENMEIRQVAYTLTYTTALTGTFRIKVNGSTVYSVAPASMGATTVKTTVTLNSYPTLPAGQKAIFTLVGDISTSASAGTTYLAALDVTQVKRLSTNDLIDPNGSSDNTSANTLTVSAAALSVSKNASFPNAVVVAGLSNAMVGSYNITASSTEDVAISSVTVGLTNTTNVSNLLLKVGSTQYGSTTNTPASSNVISISDLTVPKGTTKTLDVYITTNSSTTGTEVTSITAVSATGKSSGNTVTATGLTATGQTITISTGGTLTVVLDTTNTPVGQVMHSGIVDETLLAARVTTNVAEAVKVKNVQVTAANGDADLKDLKLFVDGSQVGSTVQLVKGAALFSDTNGLFTVPQDTTKILYVKGSSTASGTMNSQATVNIMIDYVEGMGVSGSSTIKPGTTLSTSWTATDTTTAGASLTVGDTTGFHAGAVVFVYDGTNGGQLGTVTVEPTSTTAMTVSTRAAITYAGSATISKIASGATTAASAGTPTKAGVSITVTSSSGFNVGDPVIVQGATGPELGYVSAIADSTHLTIATITAGAIGVASRVSKIGTDTVYTTLADTTLGITAIATTVTSTSGFNVGDLVLVQDTTVDGSFGVVTAVGSSTGITVMLNAAVNPTSATSATLVRIGAINPATTLVSTAASAGTRAIAATATTVTSSTGFGVRDVVVTTGTGGAELGVATVITDAVTMSINSASAIGGAATRVTRLPGAASAGKLITMHDVEPVITVASTPAGGSATGQSGQEVAKYNVLASGDRNMSITSVNVQANGNNLPWNYVTSYDLYSGSTLLSSATPLNSTTTATTSSNALTGTSIELCTADVTAAGEIRLANAAAVTAAGLKIAVGDTIVLYVSATSYITAKVTAKTTSASCSVGPAATDITLTVSNSSTTGTIPTSATITAIKSFNVLFDSNSSTPLSSQTITAGSTLALTVKADTTSVRTGLGAGTTASYNTKINGTQGLASGGGLTWGYTPSGGSAISGLTISDSYPVNGPTFTY